MMKKRKTMLFVLLIMVSLAACGNGRQGGGTSEPEVKISGAESESPAQPESSDIMESENFGSDTETEDGAGQTSMAQDESLTQPEGSQEEKVIMNIQAGEHVLTAALEENSSAKELLNLLSQGPVTVDMRDYGSMEKVGSLPQSLPRNDEPITTTAGDLILYQGNSFVIYYDTNTWELTRLGRIEAITQQELKDILGEGNVTVVLSLLSQ